MISPGKTIALDFEVDVVEKGQVRRVAFRELLGKKTLVSVYMKNNTGSCDKQVASLVEAAEKLRKKGVTVVALSRDKAASHQKYAAKTGASFALVSDPEDLFSKAADAVVEKSMYGKKYYGPARAAYLLDKQGVVLAVIPKVDTGAHGDEVLALLD